MNIIDKIKKNYALRIAIIVGILGTTSIIINNGHIGTKESEIIKKLFYKYEIYYFIPILFFFAFKTTKSKEEEKNTSVNLIYDSTKNPKLLLKLNGLEKNIQTKNILKEIKTVKNIDNFNNHYAIHALMNDKKEKYIFLKLEKDLKIFKITKLKIFTLEDILKDKSYKGEKRPILPKQIIYLTALFFFIIILSVINFNFDKQTLLLIFCSIFLSYLKQI